MLKNLIVIMMGVVALVLGVLSKISVLKIVGITVAIILIVFGLFWTIGFILDKKNKNIEN